MNSGLTSTITAISILTLSQQPLPAAPVFEQVLSSRQISLEDRYEDAWVNNIFKENILLNLAYLRGTVSGKSEINWEEIKKPFIFEFKLNPNRTFAYHDDVLEKYKGRVSKTSNAHFNAKEGFKSDGYLFGDGVCHLASLIYWVAKDANLDSEAPVNHDFANIAGIPKKMGVSILSLPGNSSSSQKQNLYITNNRPKTITFKFEYKDNNLKVSALETN